MKKKAGRAVACAGVRVSAAPQRRLTDQLPSRRAAMRNKFLLMFLFLAISGPAAAWDDSLTADSTFSIIARDVGAGELGMAVQSKAHAVGSRTISARGGLAVIAHQAVSNPMYGQIGLELLQRGYSPQRRSTIRASSLVPGRSAWRSIGARKRTRNSSTSSA